MKRLAFSVFAGALVAMMLSLSSTTMAACLGYCADRQAGGGIFDSCIITLDRNNEAISQPQCFYTTQPKITPVEEAY
jgi:hypothetical protein